MNTTLVLRIYLLSLPRKSEKSVKIGNRKPYREPPRLGGGILGRDYTIGNRLGGDTPTPPMQSLLASVFPPPAKGAYGASGPWFPLGLGPWVPPAGGHGALWALGQPPKGMTEWELAHGSPVHCLWSQAHAPPYRRIQPARGARIRVGPPWPPDPIGFF